MSNEEMQFADPEWQPPGQEQSDPRPVNAPRDEQSGWQSPPREESPDYNAGYRAQQQRSYSVPPVQQRKRPAPWTWIIIALIVLLFLGGGPFFEGGYFIEGFVFRNIIFALIFLGVIVSTIAVLRNRGAVTFRNTRAVETRTFLVGTHPTIIVKDDIGTIRVHSGGQSDTVSVQTTRQSTGWTGNNNNPQVYYDQRSDDNIITIKSAHGWRILGKNSVDFDITVPLTTDLQRRTDLGKIYVNDVIGQMSLTSDAGSIHATQVSLMGRASLKTDVGSINFSGSIEPRGTYKFESDAGSINVTLPENASFHVDAKTDVGSVNTDFPVSGQSSIGRNKLGGDVGSPPYAVLTLKTDVGSINLKRGVSY